MVLTIFITINVILSSFIVLAFAYDIYKTWENELAIIYSKLKSNKLIFDWFKMFCDLMIGASSSVISIVMLAFAIVIAIHLGIPMSIGSKDILNSSAIFLVTVFIYSVVVATIFWYFKRKLTKK